METSYTILRLVRTPNRGSPPLLVFFTNSFWLAREIQQTIFKTASYLRLVRTPNRGSPLLVFFTNNFWLARQIQQIIFEWLLICGW